MAVLCDTSVRDPFTCRQDKISWGLTGGSEEVSGADVDDEILGGLSRAADKSDVPKRVGARVGAVTGAGDAILATG